ncbi:U2 small nuclear RNA auxiliary factor 2 [Linnemannia gamsii]|uniref:U2 snRNP auxiliary factor large subunit n=1 Tax=Linnemannia gamsii TaxID=64522 RepID=A0A9P6QTA5_9FUNG|nr:U2 small nuclear RNA auxiliary factor 2 [Linnemannia gamsii]
MLPTPDLSHLKRKDYEFIYEPAEDTFLFLDAFEDEVNFLKELQPTISLEIGSGSGCVTAFVGKILGESNCLKYCTDINPKAARATQGTAKQNQLSVDIIETHLVSGLLPRLGGQIDLMYFNPPYVLTPSEEVGSHSVEAAWAGGIDGREVIDEFLPYVKRLLSAKGAFYMVVVNENKPDEIREIMKNDGFDSSVVRTQNPNNSKGEPLSGRASELANSFLTELTTELSAPPMGSSAKRTLQDDRERSERSERHRGERGERGYDERERERRGGEREHKDRGERDRGDRDRGDRDRRDRDRDYERYERDRRDRDRSRERRSGRDDRHRDSRYGGRRSSRSRSPPRDMSPMMDEHSVLPINKRVRKLKNWDLPPPGYEDKTVQEVKALGIFPPPGQPAVLRSEILQGMDPERAAQLVHELPPRPLRMNYPPMGGPGGMGGHFNNMGFGGFRNNSHHHNNSGGPPGPNGVDHTVARQQRRLYCGNLPPGINEESLADFFNQTMMSMNLTTASGAPVVSVHINFDKNYAFVEFRTPEEATAAMAFDGIVFQAQTLKIRRPKDYQPPEGTIQEVPQIHVPGVISTNVPDSENKIFIGGLPLYLNDEQVIELLTAFGELKAFNLVKENNIGPSKGFAFCEYLDPKLTDIACQGLNNMMLGEKKLVVQRASVGSSRNNQNPAGGANAIALHPNLMLPGAGPTEVVPTNVLQLLNMVSPEELEDDQEYEDIIEDIRDECSKFGQVLEVKIPRPVAGHAVPGVGKIFVKYASAEETTVALSALSGRKFADRTVLTSFYDTERFAANEF